ncbi:MAG: hypothetical protein HYT70_03425 [Candidatus Aenigmarchaeota archaeon]|nr:hypothetical protein [Candidatus Aenigmarchaeota archaeon]
MSANVSGQLRDWTIRGDFSHRRNGPTVIFDQSFGPDDLAEDLEALGVRSARAPTFYALHDEKIRKIAEYFGGIVLTRDKGFQKYDGSLVVNGHIGQHDKEDLKAAILYVFDIIHTSPKERTGSKLPYKRDSLATLMQYLQQMRE